MKKEILFLVLLIPFLAFGCTNQNQKTTQTQTPQIPLSVTIEPTELLVGGSSLVTVKIDNKWDKPMRNTEVSLIGFDTTKLSPSPLEPQNLGDIDPGLQQVASFTLTANEVGPYSVAAQACFNYETIGRRDLIIVPQYLPQDKLPPAQESYTKGPIKVYFESVMPEYIKGTNSPRQYSVQVVVENELGGIIKNSNGETGKIDRITVEFPEINGIDFVSAKIGSETKTGDGEAIFENIQIPQSKIYITITFTVPPTIDTIKTITPQVKVEYSYCLNSGYQTVTVKSQP